MKKLTPFLLFVLLAFSISCGKGIEAGNPTPNIADVKITLYPGGSSDDASSNASKDYYEVQLIDSEKALVTKHTPATANAGKCVIPEKCILKDVSESESIIADITTEGDTLIIDVEFSDDQHITIFITLDKDNNIINIGLKIDFETVDIEYKFSEISDDPSEFKAVDLGMVALESRDIALAEEQFCEGLTEDTANSQLAFGCFMAQLLSLPETSEITTLLGYVNEPAIDMDYTLGAQGMFSRNDPNWHYQDTRLPFARFTREYGSLTPYDQFLKLINRVIDNSATIDMIKDQVYGTRNSLLSMEANLEIAANANYFSFYMPKELFYMNRDTLILNNDVKIFLAAIKHWIVLLDWIDAYDFGIELHKVMTDGDIDHEKLVADLNGTGEIVNQVQMDETAFLTLTDAELIQSSRRRFLEALHLYDEALRNIIIDGDRSDIFDELSGSDGHDSLFNTIDDLIRSAEDGDTRLSHRTNIRIDLRNFFLTPPSADQMSIEAGDPFVLEDGTTRPVESYFREFFDGYITFD